MNSTLEFLRDLAVAFAMLTGFAVLVGLFFGIAISVVSLFL